MTRYRVIVHGRMIPIGSANGAMERGFYVPVMVQASSATEAGIAALAAAANDPWVDSLCQQWQSSRPDLEVDGTVLLEVSGDTQGHRLGMVVDDASQPAP